MSHLRAFFVANVVITRFFVANVVITRFFCRECRDYVLFGVEFWQKFWQKFLEILRILAEILRKKLATGASALVISEGTGNFAKITNTEWIGIILDPVLTKQNLAVLVIVAIVVMLVNMGILINQSD